MTIEIYIEKQNNEGKNTDNSIPSRDYYRVKLYTRQLEETTCEERFFSHRIEKHYIILKQVSGPTEGIKECILGVAHSKKQSEDKLYNLCVDAAKKMEKQNSVIIHDKIRKKGILE